LAEQKGKQSLPINGRKSNILNLIMENDLFHHYDQYEGYHSHVVGLASKQKSSDDVEGHAALKKPERAFWIMLS